MVHTTGRRSRVVALALLLAPLSSLAAQTTTAAAAAPAASGPSIGDVAPDFALAAATRYGALRDPVRLADFRGQTVVLAFFYKARTKG